MKKFIIFYVIVFIYGLTVCKAGQKTALTRQATITLLFQSDPGTDSIHVSLFDIRNYNNYLRTFNVAIINKKAVVTISQNHIEIIVFEIKKRGLLAYFGYTSMSGYFIEPGDNIKFDIGPDYEHGLLNINFSGIGAEKYIYLKQSVIKVHDELPPWRYGQPVEMGLQNEVKGMNIQLGVLKQYKRLVSRAMYQQMVASTVSECLAGVFYQWDNEKDFKVQSALYKKYIFPFKSKLLGKGTLYDYNVYIILAGMAEIEYFIDRHLPFDESYFKSHDRTFMTVISQKYPAPAVNQLLSAYFISLRAAKYGWNLELLQFANEFIKRKDVNANIRTQIAVLIKQYNNRLAKGNKAYEFTLKDTTGKLMKQSDFINRVVVLDFFFNGCVGCYSMAPVLDSLEKLYKNKDVSFISISIDKDATIWKKGIGTFSSKHSLQLYTNGMGQEHTIVKYYDIYSYPTLIMIDKKGRIIAARPPDPRSKHGLVDFCSMLDNAINL